MSISSQARLLFSRSKKLSPIVKIKRKVFNSTLFFMIFVCLTATSLKSQDVYLSTRNVWLQKAEVNKPELVSRTYLPKDIVTVINDNNAFQKWSAKLKGHVDSLYYKSFKKESGVVIDFGQHLTGQFSFNVESIFAVQDAPLRFKLTFAEVPSELATPFDPYTGSLSRAWLQDEIITVSVLPSKITIPRRLAFRYVKIELLGSSPYFDFAITYMDCKATTAVSSIPPMLASTSNEIIEKIDRVGLATLSECMQTVYEDGPKRDRRLWIGDLFLESLANSYSFKNFSLTKRCLYLLAGLSNENGLLYSNVFELPQPHAQVGAPFLFDYALLYNVALHEYLVSTGDMETARDLWPVAVKQIQCVKKFLNEDGLFDSGAAQKAGWWLFVDWKEELDKQTALQGIMIYSIKHTLQLAKALDKEDDVKELTSIVNKMTGAARKNLFDKKRGVFVSGSQNQVSYASQAWMILSGVPTKAEAQNSIKQLQVLPNVIKPGAPYLYHYFIQALIDCDLKSDAKSELINYWGGMVEKGADTFWEVYDPNNDFLSPYNFFPVNSYCHAWSCTPVYFIRKYPEIFQR